MMNLGEFAVFLKTRNVNIKYDSYNGWCTSVSINGYRINKIGFKNISDAIIQCAEIIKGHTSMAA